MDTCCPDWLLKDEMQTRYVVQTFNVNIKQTTPNNGDKNISSLANEYTEMHGYKLEDLTMMTRWRLFVIIRQ